VSEWPHPGLQGVGGPPVVARLSFDIAAPDSDGAGREGLPLQQSPPRVPRGAALVLRDVAAVRACATRLPPVRFFQIAVSATALAASIIAGAAPAFITVFRTGSLPAKVALPPSSAEKLLLARSCESSENFI